MTAGYYTGSYDSGISLTTPSVTLTGAGYIDAYGAGLYAYSGTYAVLNGGTIKAGNDGIYLDGTVTNKTHGVIEGGTDGVLLIGDGDSVANSGTIVGSYGYGVALETGGTITNASSGLIEGAGGITLGGAGTVVNRGTIEGTTGYAVYFGSSDDVLEVASGAKFVGEIQGGGGTFEFAGTKGTESGLGSGTLTGSVDADVTGFTSYVIASGADWTLTGQSTLAGGEEFTVDGTLEIAASAALTIDGTVEIGPLGVFDVQGTATGDVAFADGTGLLEVGKAIGSGIVLDGASYGDRIDFTKVAYDAGAMSATYAGGHLNLYSGASLVASVAASGLSGFDFSLKDDGSGGTVLEIVCFAHGTRILTERGEIAVEALRPGDRVATFSGKGPALKPIRWIGRRRIDATRHREPEKVYPIRIRADAFGEGQPYRDLLVSRDHAIWWDGMLVPAGRLVNGATIVQDRSIGTIEYFHVELDSHEILLAEGLAAESYLDDGNRDFFENGGGAVRLGGAPGGERADPGRWCAPVIRDGLQLEDVRWLLVEQAQALGWQVTEQPALDVVAEDGSPLAVEQIGDSLYRAILPDRAQTVRLRSAAGTPVATDPGNEDERRLGVSVVSLALVGDGKRRLLPLGDEGLFGEGWHVLESDGERRWRWTDGDAALSLPGGGVIEIAIGAAIARWQRPPEHLADLSLVCGLTG